MNIQQRTSLIYRIIQGRFKCEILGQKYIVHTPSLEILIDAQALYDELIEENKYKEWLRSEDCERILIRAGLWKIATNDELKALNDHLDNLKVDLYKNFVNFQTRRQIKANITETRVEIEKLEDTKHSLDYLTVKGYASIIQNQYILSKTVNSFDNKLAFSNLDTTNYSLLNIIQYSLNENIITIEQYKELARNEPWVSMWRVSKNDIFPLKGVQLSIEQRNLILYSQMYDNIHEHPEAPSEEVINDSDALDGWMISQKRERDSKKMESSIDDAGFGNAQEVFIPVSSGEEARKINDMNSFHNKIIKAQRQAALAQAEGGRLEVSQLPDQRQLINQMAVNQAREHMRK